MQKSNTKYKSAFETQKNVIQNTRARSTRRKCNAKYQSTFHTHKIQQKTPECVQHVEEYNTKYKSALHTGRNITQNIRAHYTHKKIQHKLPDYVPHV